MAFNNYFPPKLIVVRVTTKTPDTTAAITSITPTIDNVSKYFIQYMSTTQRVLFRIFLIQFHDSSYSVIVNTLNVNLITYLFMDFFFTVK